MAQTRSRLRAGRPGTTLNEEKLLTRIAERALMWKPQEKKAISH